MDDQPASVLDRGGESSDSGTSTTVESDDAMPSVGRTDPAGPQAVLSYVMRRVGLLVVVALIAAAAAYLISSAREPRFSATAKIAFVEDTRFDYVDAERDRLIGFAESVDGREITARDGIVSVDFERPSLETFFDVEVHARSAELAAVVANDLADVIVAGDLALRVEPIDREAEALADRNLILDAQIAELDESIATSTQAEAFAESVRFSSDPATLASLTIELRESQDARNVAIREKNQLQELRGESVVRIAELEAERTGVVASTRIVRPALESSSPEGPSASLVAVLAALGVFVIGATGLCLAAPYSARSDQ